MSVLVLFFFAPVVILTAVIVTTRAPLDPLIRGIALGTTCLCLTTAALQTLR